MIQFIQFVVILYYKMPVVCQFKAKSMLIWQRGLQIYCKDSPKQVVNGSLKYQEIEKKCLKRLIKLSYFKCTENSTITFALNSKAIFERPPQDGSVTLKNLSYKFNLKKF